MTRRDAIRLGIVAGVACPSAWAFAPKEFWNEKQPADWTEEERQELLTHSPWAKEPITNYNSGPAAVPVGKSVSTSRTRGGGANGRGSSNAGSDPKVPGKYQSVIRWESALPIREANHNKSKDDPAANYILKAIGDLPMLQQGTDETESGYAHRLEMLKQYTKLEKKGEPIYLTDMRYDGKGQEGGALFYFVRNDLISLSDKTVTFVTKLGPIEVKVKFTLHEMLYQGKLEL